MKYGIYLDSLHWRLKVFSISSLPKSAESSTQQGKKEKVPTPRWFVFKGVFWLSIVTWQRFRCGTCHKISCRENVCFMFGTATTLTTPNQPTNPRISKGARFIGCWNWIDLQSLKLTASSPLKMMVSKLGISEIPGAYFHVSFREGNWMFVVGINQP